MKWDIFSNKKKGQKSTEQEEIDGLIKVIEKFAPRKYRKERDLFYYNYRILERYISPLKELLKTIAQKDRLKKDSQLFTQDLFFRLKDFYDLSDRLPVKEALEDRNLLRKFQDLFVFFYEQRGYSFRDLKRVLNKTGGG